LIAERLARRARATIEEIAAAGARDKPTERATSLRRLAAEARSIGLFDLADRLEDVARWLDDPSDDRAFTEALLASYDRVEALSSALARRALARAFGADEEGL